MGETFIIANRTDVGRAREHNEDCMVTFDSPNGRVVAVCDGMGGQAAGDVASRLACDIISDILTNNTFTSPTEAITRAVLAANQGILHRAAQNPELTGMGATCVIVIIKDGLVYYGWVGDSRIYYIHGGVISQISRDQSYVQQLVDQGHITAAEAEHHPLKNEITNALGLETMTPPELGMAPLSPEQGSVILLCSDGLSGMVDDNTINRIVSNDGLTLQQRVDELVNMANNNGGTDNITVQLIEFGTSPALASVVKHKAVKTDDKSKWVLYGSILVAIAVLAVVLVLLFGGKKQAPKKIIVEEPKIEDNRVVTPKASNTAPATQTVTTTTTTVEKSSSKKQNQSKSSQKKESNSNKILKDNKKNSEKQNPKESTTGDTPRGSAEDAMFNRDGQHL